MTTALVILIYKQNGRLGDKVNYIQVERTLIIDDAMVGVGNDAYFNIENNFENVEVKYIEYVGEERGWNE